MTSFSRPFLHQDCFSWIHHPHHQTMLSWLSSDGGEGRFVGGVVRNSLLGQTPDDFDIATTHLPEKVMALLQSKGLTVIPTGLSHGTVTALWQNFSYEITTLRQDVSTDGRWAKVAYTSCWKEDAARRDFTMNALYLDQKGQLYDYFQGKRDLQNGIVRFIGNPQARIQEDYLRLLRFFRFQAFYGKNYHQTSLEASCAFKEKLSTLSGERITKEVMRLLEAPNPWPVLKDLLNFGFFPLIFGQENCESFNFHRVLAWVETLLGPQNPLLRLSSLLRPPYPRLILSKNTEKHLGKLTQPLFSHHREDCIEALYENTWDIVYQRGIATLCQTLSSCFSKNISPDPALINNFVNDMAQLKALIPLPTFPLTGKDFCQMGFTGRQIAWAKQKVQRWWIENHFHPSPQECLQYASSLITH